MKTMTSRSKLIAVVATALGFVAAGSVANAQNWYYINGEPVSRAVAQLIAAKGLPFGYYWLQPNGNWGGGQLRCYRKHIWSAPEPLRARAIILSRRVATVA